jgi:type IV pilus assembly protein PilQ
MKSALSRISISLLLGSMSQSLLAANLQALDVAALPGDKVELKLTFDEPVAVPRGYTIEQPARIALDLPGVTNKLGAKNRELGVGNARSVTVVEAGDRTRLIVNLTNLAPYNARVEGNNLFVVIGEGAVNSSSLRTSTVATPVRAAPKPYMAVGKAIKSVDFQRGEQGAGNVVIELSDPSVSPDIQDQGGKITLNFPKTQLPDALRVRLDVKDFATPVQFVNAQSRGDKATISIEPTGLYDYLAYQADNKLIVSIKPLSAEEKDKRQAESFIYSGEKLSLNFQSIEVRSVLQLIADFTDLNLVASDTVQGDITLRLQNVPWDQALDLVLKTKGLDKRKIGNVLLVAPADEIAARERQELESQKQIAELAPLRQDFIQLNYAKASDIAKLFENESASGKLEEDARGRIIFDDRTNALIVNLTQARIDEIRRVVTQLDIPVRQVMIEARIVEANVDYSKELGVRWRGVSTLAGGNFAMDGVNGSGVGVNLAAAGTSSIGIGFITDNTILDLELSAMESSGNGEVVSQPKVVTSDKETAKILKGTEIPYQEASSSGATSTSFKEAVLSLEVTPQITPDNRVLMEVKVTKDEPIVLAGSNGVPSIKKNEVDAKVLVADGETIVIGGVFSNTQTKTVDKVPFLGDLPYLGRLFRRDIVQDRKSELLVFITPRILNSQAQSLSK